MTERSKRRAAARKANKLAQKNSAQTAQPRAATATAQGQTLHSNLDDQPPSGHDHFEESKGEASRLAARDTTISPAQLAANHANAQHSTGPSSAAGKAISSRNNFRHGLTQTEGDLILLPDESKEDYSQSLSEFQKEWQPATATERDLVERLTSHQWLRRRAMKLQTRFLTDEGQIRDYEQYTLYRRYEATHERSFNKALADLMRLRSLQLREQNGFESQQRKNEEHAFRIRALQHREKLHELAIRTAEAKAGLAEDRLLRSQPLQVQNSAGERAQEPPQ